MPNPAVRLGFGPQLGKVQVCQVVCRVPGSQDQRHQMLAPSKQGHCHQSPPKTFDCQGAPTVPRNDQFLPEIPPQRSHVVIAAIRRPERLIAWLLSPLLVAANGGIFRRC